MLLTRRRIRQTYIDKNGTKQAYTTHARIETLQKKHPDARKQLMAVKWIGNAGSHTDKLTSSDVVAGAEHLELALRLLYDKRDEMLKRSADRINKRKGVPRRRTAQ